MKKPIVEKGSIEEQIEIVKASGTKPRLLLHACCGPCASSVLEYLTPYFEITVFYYNPNILPKEEFIRRLEALKVVISHFDGVKLVVPEQSENEYLTLVKGLENEPEGGKRCGVCFALRLDGTARYMATNEASFDFFATTLTVSPHKDNVRINEIGCSIAKKYDVEYLSSNFKKRDGYLRSTQLSKEFGIYRQDYCGCKL
ncbi:MAG: epoxyqueuosine reductase QueH [Clostridia bacterium]|nr:epoxyqueuosine reductase QueH [Clostridia bacterium]